MSGLTCAKERAAPRGVGQRVRIYLALVRFSHTLFALPFAVMALFLVNPGHWPRLGTALLLLLAMVSARTAAMAYNRLLDRDIDARNPRTRQRHLPAGLVSALEVFWLVAASSVTFLVTAWFFNRLTFYLAFPVLFLLLFYSHTKRFTSASHFALGLVLACAPPGVWVAVRGTVDASFGLPVLLGVAVLLWVSGFDILYACQDVSFDRREGLHSLPVLLGTGPALLVMRLLHGGVVLALLGLAWLAHLGVIYLIGVALTALLLLYEHALVKKDDLSRVDLAFFTVNGAISLLLCACTVLDVMW